MKIEIIKYIANYVAPILEVIIQFCALAWAYREYKRHQRNHKESLAKGIYSDYLKLAVEYPDLAYPSPRSIKELTSSENFKKYTWFVSYVLVACDEILSLCSHNIEDGNKWKTVIKEQIKFHKVYLSSSEFLNTREIEGYSEELKKLINEVREHKNSDNKDKILI